MSSTFAHAKDCVILLHGLARTSNSMQTMEKSLTKEGYVVHNIDYPSTSATIETLAKGVREQIVACSHQNSTVHIVTHSMGGILVRQIQKTKPISKLGRVVMLSPPNNGSEAVDKLRYWWAFEKLNGPAGQQLGTKTDGIVKKLGSVDFELAVITGDRSINWILSAMIPGKDDGKVSLESAKVEGMKAYKAIHATHPYIMQNKEAIAETISFLKTAKLLAHDAPVAKL